MIKHYKENPDAYFLPYQLEYNSLTYRDIYNILYTDSCDRTWDEERRCYQSKYFSYFSTLINDFGYHSKPLMLYLDELKTLEAIDDMSFLIRELYDYANMMQQISPKFDKYPRNFLTSHKIACRNYNRMKEVFDEQTFERGKDKSLEHKYKDYIFIYPESTQDIKDEAVQQNNCVASYIKRVIDGTCHILFLRHKDSPDKSLVTIEVQDNKIVQARGKFNRQVFEDEQKAIDSWNKKFNNKKEIGNYVA